MFFLSILLSSLGFAEDTASYRSFDLIDGRTVSGAVVNTTDTGFMVRDKTGVFLIRFEDMTNMINISQSEFDSQASRVIYLYQDDSISDRSKYPITQAQTATKGVTWKNNADLPFSKNSLQECNEQTMCIVTLLEEHQIAELLYMTQEKNVLRTYAFYPDINRQPIIKELPLEDPKFPDFTKIYSLMIETMGYNTPTKPSLPLMMPPESTAIDWTTWVPLAGLPSMTAQDPVGAAKSLAIAIPSSLFLVYLSGRSASTKGQFFLTSVGAYSIASIGANLVVANPPQRQKKATRTDNTTEN